MDNTLLCVSLERFLERDLLNLLSLFLAGPMRGYAEMPRWEGQSQSCSIQVPRLLVVGPAPAAESFSVACGR